MSDDFSFCQVDHEFGHIRGMIGNTFEVLADEREANGAGDGVGFSNMKESNSRNNCCVRSSMKSSSAQTFRARPATESIQGVK